MRSGLQESIPLGSPLGSNVSADPACGFRHETYHSQNALAFNKSPPKDKREGASDASVPLLNEVREAFDDVAEEHGVQEAPGEGPSALPLPRATPLASTCCASLPRASNGVLALATRTLARARTARVRALNTVCAFVLAPCWTRPQAGRARRAALGTRRRHRPHCRAPTLRGLAVMPSFCLPYRA